MKKLFKWLKSLFVKVKGFSEKYIPISVGIVDGIKRLIDSGKLDITADLLKSVIPGLKDDIIIDKVVSVLKKQIPIWCEKLGIIQEDLNTLSGIKWELFTSGLAGSIANELSDGKVSIEQATRDSKEFYDNFIKIN